MPGFADPAAVPDLACSDRLVRGARAKSWLGAAVTIPTQGYPLAGAAGVRAEFHPQRSVTPARGASGFALQAPREAGAERAAPLEAHRRCGTLSGKRCLRRSIGRIRPTRALIPSVARSQLHRRRRGSAKAVPSASQTGAMFRSMSRLAHRLAAVILTAASRTCDSGIAAAVRLTRSPLEPGPGQRPCWSPEPASDGIALRYGRMAFPPERRLRLRRPL